MEELEELGRVLLGTGLESREIGVLQMGLRAVIIYVVTLIVVRLAKKRFMGRATAFDVILGIMLGSVASRAITGNAPMLPAMAATAVMVAMHWIFSAIAVRWQWFGHLIKGRPDLLIEDGTVEEKALRHAHMTGHDLREDLRSKGIADPAEVREGRLERSGQLSVLRKPPRVVEVRVAEGVQTVRVEIG